MEDFQIRAEVTNKTYDTSTWGGWISAQAGKLLGGQSVVQLKATKGSNEVFAKVVEDTVQVSNQNEFEIMMNNHDFVPISTKEVYNRSDATDLKPQEVVFVKVDQLAMMGLKHAGKLKTFVANERTPIDLKIVQIKNNLSFQLSAKVFFDNIRSSLVDKWSEPVQPAVQNRAEQFVQNAPRIKLTSAQRKGLVSVRTGGSETIASDPEKRRDWTNAEGFVYELAQSGEPLSFDNLCEVNRLINGADNDEIGGGQVRDHPVQAGGRAGPSFPSNDDVEELLFGLLDEINEGCERGDNPVVLAAGAYQKLVSIHPFGDGNGRTCRLAMDYVLLRAGLPPPSLQGEEINLALFGKQKCEFLPKEESTTSAVEAVLAGVQRTYRSLDEGARDFAAGA